MFYYKKSNVFAEKKEKINFVQGYFKITVKRIGTKYQKYIERFFVGYI